MIARWLLSIGLIFLRTFAQGIVTVLVPGEFHRLPRSMVAAKYRPHNAHWVVYGTETGNASVLARFLLQRIDATTPREAVVMLRRAWKEGRPNDVWHDRGMHRIGGREFALFDIESNAADSRIYNVMAMTLVHGRILLVTFNMTWASRDGWLPLARRSIASIRVDE